MLPISLRYKIEVYNRKDKGERGRCSKRKSRKGVVKMFALYFVCLACGVGMSFRYNLEGRCT